MPKQIEFTKSSYTNLSKTKSLPNIKINFLNREINFMTIEAILKVIHYACLKKKRLIVASYNVHSLNISMQIPWFYEFQQNADIARCDGTGIIKGIKLMGIDLPLEYRASGTKLVPRLMKHCNKNGFSLFLLGSKPEYLELALNKQREKYPNLKLAGHHGYFNQEDPIQNQMIIEQINRVNPDILLVGMGMPLQESWIQKNSNHLNTSVILPCGAVIDRLAGLVSDCPVWLSDIGLEWLYRLVREPKRLASRYLLGNFAFLFHVALAKFQGFSSVSIIESQVKNDFM